MTPEQRTRVSVGRRGIHQPQATLDFLAALRRTPAFRERARLSKLGRKQTPTEKAKQVAAQLGKTGWTKGRVLTAAHRAKISAAVRGRPLSAEHRRKIGDSHRGSKSVHWLGGERPRDLADYREWKRQVHERDEFLCTSCGSGPLSGRDMHADHLMPFTAYPEYRYFVFLGRTLCMPCHMKWTARQRTLGLLRRVA